MAFLKSYAFFVLILFPCSLHVVHALNYATFNPHSNFMLRWSYDNNKLIFNMTCKVMGWCAVGFTETDTGRNMEMYDIAAGGVASNTPYLKDYWSVRKEPPPEDTVNNFKLLGAMEMGGYTSVRFERNLTTEEADKDVQFMMNTTVFIVWAMQNMDATSGSSTLGPQHGGASSNMRGISPEKHNLITEAMAAAITPTTTIMMMPSTSVVSTPQPTGMTVSAGDDFMLTWMYSNNKLMFTMKCKTTGWCAVAFTTGDGSGMKNYDIALGGVASGTNYLDDYWSKTTGKPSKDTKNFVLTSASEAGGYTTVVFERDPETSDTDNDVQFKPGTDVKIAWAKRDTSDGNVDIAVHTARGILPDRYTLVPGTGGTSTTIGAASMFSAILAAIAVFLVS
ncbi:unnamed protein product [Porites lobata]|uniref:DOMON domain-containing protein n=1 Tax=Porites lobata TaxID=104759 RepID=A0ABN8NP85_9CNID|nr:unnamed protein product [Porites lobata]